MTNIVEGLKPLAVPLTELKPLANNPRIGDVDAVARSYEAFGQRKPIVARKSADGKGEILAGNHQFAAAQKLGWDSIAVVWVDDDDTKASAYAVADNSVGLLGSWDVENLLESLTSLDDDLLAATGFVTDDIDDFFALLQEGDETVTASVDAKSHEGTGEVDEDTRVKADLTYQEFLERYAQRATRGVILEFPAEEYAWVNEQFVAYRTKHNIDSNTNAVIKLLSDANGTEPPVGASE
jgi:hypothetical protein